MTSQHEQLLAAALSEYLDNKAAGRTADAEAALRRFALDYPTLETELLAQVRALEGIDESTTVTPAGGAPAGDAPEPLPATLSGCEILSEIGSGGMGRVLQGYDRRLRRKVAIKMLGRSWLDHPRVRARFMKEARALARVSHPNIVRVYSLGGDDEPPHFVMEHVEGSAVTSAAAPLTIRQKVELFRKVVVAVAFLHQHGILHRDLKPGNILTGADLEPKILDFGLARQMDDSLRLTRDGEVLGTPLYFSPEQARGEALEAPSDVFSLGVLLYELLTGTLPFQAASLAGQIREICERDPVLPRRLDSSIPGDLQNVCLKALEKDPADRYQTAIDFARDLERFLDGEPVLAAPRSYPRLISSQIERHLADIDSWRGDRVVNVAEYDALRKAYDHLFDRDDAWIMEFRRLAIPQVLLYLGAWILTVGAALLFLFRYPALGDAPSLLVVAAAAAATALAGVRSWKRGHLRTSIAFLLASCFLLPITLLIAMHSGGWLTGFSHGRRDLEFLLRFEALQPTTNTQIWWAICLSLPAYLWLRRYTRASVFALVFATFSTALALATLLRMGLLEWIDTDPGRLYLNLLPFAALFFLAGLWLERRCFPSDSRYFYTYAVLFTFVALTGVVTFHEPYREWLQRSAPWTRGQLEYLFLLNALVYAALQEASERFAMPQMRSVAKAFRFVIPGHVLGALLFLGLAATARFHDDASLRLEARLFEILLPAAALGFVLLSVPRQMKNFLASGLLFLAIGIVRLQQNLLRDRAAWPVLLILAGLALLFLSAGHFSFRFRRRHPGSRA